MPRKYRPQSKGSQGRRERRGRPVAPRPPEVLPLGAGLAPAETPLEAVDEGELAAEALAAAEVVEPKPPAPRPRPLAAPPGRTRRATSEIVERLYLGREVRNILSLAGALIIVIVVLSFVLT